MPYRVRGKNVEHFKDGKWSVKQRATSERNAHIIVSNLEKLEKNPRAKVFGGAKKRKRRRPEPGKGVLPMANWIQGAIKHPGSFTKQAKEAGMGVQQYARKVLKKGSKASATTKRRAALARTLKKLGRRKRRRPEPGKGVL